MYIVALLRGVMPSGQNSIPKMAYLVEILKEAGFQNVQTYIQSGNILLETNLSFSKTAALIHNIILEKIGADLSVIIKTKEQLKIAIAENPFDESYDFSRIHLVFTNDQLSQEKLMNMKTICFHDEIFHKGNECFYMYLPHDAQKKKLNNNFLERQLGIVATTRKLNVIKHLYDMLR